MSKRTKQELKRELKAKELQILEIKNSLEAFIEYVDGFENNAPINSNGVFNLLQILKSKIK